MAARSLVIVESPAKARTIGGILGKDFVVESSIGHIRDLPRSASEVPASVKKAPWARLGVDVEHGFRPVYVVDADKRDHVKKLKGLLAQADVLYLATDEDREGESIAWHLAEVLAPKIPVRRMVFHEITASAIREAIAHPRDIDRRLVEAQEARRILDRLYGYEVSPVLWKKVLPRLSAGRVQSVAVRIVVERERERIAFRRAAYYGIEATLELSSGGAPVPAQVVQLDGARLATGKDFGSDGKLTRAEALVLDQQRANALVGPLERAAYVVREIERKPTRRSPPPPFMTSTLQQEAARKLRFSSKRTMQVAQRLYENGFITYMRTDSTTLSDVALSAARAQIERLYGREYLPAAPRTYANKVKNAQEAHEAIRPAGEAFRLPEEVARELGGDEARLYELVWMRTVASQMVDSRGESVVARVEARPTERGAPFEVAELTASGNVIVFPGFLRAYVEGSDDPQAELEGRERPLPAMDRGQALAARAVEAQGHETQPPARLTEASLVRALEELGVGRPSTYSSILSTIQDRGYVWKKGTALVPSFTAFSVVKLLEQHFGDLVDFAFTARMEDDLDSIARGAQACEPWLRRFYYGGGDTAGTFGVGLKALVADRLEGIDARAINSWVLGKDSEGRELTVRVGKYGAYLARGEETATLAEDLAPDELDVSKAEELLARPSADRALGTDPGTGLPVLLRVGRFGAYVQVGEATAGGERPRTASLLKSVDPAQATLEDALRVLALPRVLGDDPASGVPITAQIGRYGPYVARGKESRSLDSEDAVFRVTRDEALALFAQPPRRAARAAAAAPLREFGPDPASGKPIVLREGRFGPYVTDGETHASLRRGDTPESVTPERAHELLAERRARGPAPGRRGLAKSKRGAGKARASAPAGDGARAAKKKRAPSAAAKKPAAAARPKRKAKSSAAEGPAPKRARAQAEASSPPQPGADTPAAPRRRRRADA
ncbi:MAG: type I DNA topoisomerase [Polyangiaceae bacterium]|nr:type I DNA topoisomerase [Polyangiaceae bacterium]